MGYGIVFEAGRFDTDDPEQQGFIEKSASFGSLNIKVIELRDDMAPVSAEGASAPSTSGAPMQYSQTFLKQSRLDVLVDAAKSLGITVEAGLTRKDVAELIKAAQLLTAGDE